MGGVWVGTEEWQLVHQLSEWTGQDVAELLLRTPDHELRRTDRAQFAIFAFSLLALAHFRRRGPSVRVVAFAGHSLGEYTALVAAGVLSEREGAELVAARGAAMRDAARARPGSMAVVVGGDHARVEGLVAGVRETGGEVWVANVNDPGQVAVAGTPEGVDAVVRAAEATGLRTVPLAVGGAFHTPLMASACTGLRDALARVRFESGTAPVVTGVDGRPHHRAEWGPLLRHQVATPVLWRDVVSCVSDRFRPSAVVEIGAGRVLARTFRHVRPRRPVLHVGSPADVEDTGSRLDDLAVAVSGGNAHS